MSHVMNSLPTHTPAPESLAFRANLARLVSPLRRIRPTVPFWRLAAHRIPTLHLYRDLLRTAPTDHIHWRVRNIFRRNHHLTAIETTKRELTKGYKWLGIFQSAASGDPKWQAVLERYDRMVESKIEKEHWRDLIDKELEWQHRLKNRPILTGGILHATPVNPPIPRMKPQPMEISRIMVKRMKQREKRFAKLNTLSEYRDMARREREFEEGLIGKHVDGDKAVWGGKAFKDWAVQLSESSKTIYADLTRQTEKFLAPYPPELLEQVAEARRNKIENKTREHERERRGEILKSTFRRQRRGLPAHLLSRLTKDQVEQELIVRRSVAEVGYIGQLKQKKGWKLRTPKDEGKSEEKVWSVIDGTWTSPLFENALRKRGEAIMEENETRETETSTEGAATT
ncbi:hypothetical protein E1B28_004563 [Marasmius oreades]|uniref:Complex 1 LYR protein domain-containing protein n=1 Tax=Marasmius oreades TaxID=181124 RepID=A0A9P7UYT6_9AGAR|nr:uncharacterized protein E1B28_004563 [Marasmius oreades]KAG7097191.1 hypothetical protein E1B28_004563 [Marasmius oreades]